MNPLSAMVNGAVWGLALAGAVWAALRLTPRGALHTQARYLIWWLTLAAALALPFANLRFAAERPVGIQSIEAGRYTTPPIERIPVPEPPRRPWQRLSFEEGGWVSAARIVWLAIAAVLLLRLALSFAAMHRARRNASAAPDPWPRRLPAWLEAVRAGRRSIGLAASRDIGIPAAAGPGRPTILIPARLFDDLCAEDIERVGLHEAAHLARRDDCFLLLQRSIEAVLWIHPAVRLIARQLDMEREIACDDRVVNATGEPHAYAGCLTRIIELCGVERNGMAVPMMADSRARVSRRIELLLGRRTASRAWARAAATAVPLALVALTLAKAPAVVAFTAPPEVPSFTLAGAARAAASASPVPILIAVPTKEKPMNGVRRTIRLAAASAVAAAAALSAAETPQRAAPAVEAQMVALYFDTTALPAAELARSVQAAHQYVAERTRPMSIAVIAYDGAGVRVLQDFTADVSRVDSALDHLSPVSDNAVFTRTAEQQLAALESVVKMLGGLANKKALVYFNTGMARGGQQDDGQLREVIGAAIRANVAFFPIDSRGIRR